MNNLNLTVLARRREELIARIDVQRASFSQQHHPLVNTLTGIDLGLMVLARVRKNPLMIAALVAGVVIIKPGRLLPLLSTGMAIWKTVQLLIPGDNAKK